MKKYLLSFLACAVAFPIALSGCTQAPLSNAPTTSSETKIVGSALSYENYIYFANAFQSNSTMDDGYDANNTGIWRISTDNGRIATDEETSLPTGQEKVIAKVTASEYTFMYSSGKYIYFASPSGEVNPATHGKHFYERNEYFRVATDGTGLTKFYTSTKSVTQQTVLKIDGKEYLVLVDGTDTENKLVKIELGDTIKAPVVLAKEFTSVIFASAYETVGDQIAYYLTSLPDEPEYSSSVGSLIYGVDIVTGESLLKDEEDEPKALNQSRTRTMTLKKVENGQLFFTIKELSGAVELDEIYARLTTPATFSYNEISFGLSGISAFDVISAENGVTYYIFSDSSAGTYALPQDTLNFAGHKIIDQEISILFTSGDWVYFTYKNTDSNPKGMHRISVQNKVVETINNVEDFKTSNISFDGKYIYYYAPNTDNTSGAYYLHRSRADIKQANVELISTLLEEDKPSTEEE